MRPVTLLLALTLFPTTAVGQLESIREATHTCGFASITCGQTVSGTLSQLHDCSLGGGGVVDFFDFQGTAGTTVTVDAASTSFDTFLALLSPNTNDDTDDRADDDSGEGTNSRIVYTLPLTGEWTIGIANIIPFEQGTYTVRLQCSSDGGGGACTPSSTVLCLQGNRFRVSATFQTPQGQSGNAQVVELTDETGYLWFFSAQNVEAVIKVINACAFSTPRFWVFAGGLTNVRTVITVTDTQTGATKTYINPQSTPFQPVQDTNAFATCP